MTPGETDSINGPLRPRPSRYPRGPLYDFNRINPERLGRRRAETRRRVRIHVAVIVAAALAALVVVPLRGHAHVGPPHVAAVYVPPAPAGPPASSAYGGIL